MGAVAADGIKTGYAMAENVGIINAMTWPCCKGSVMRLAAHAQFIMPTSHWLV